jgi:hypothetical protein
MGAREGGTSPAASIRPTKFEAIATQRRRRPSRAVQLSVSSKVIMNIGLTNLRPFLRRRIRIQTWFAGAAVLLLGDIASVLPSSVALADGGAGSAGNPAATLGGADNSTGTGTAGTDGGSPNGFAAGGGGGGAGMTGGAGGIGNSNNSAAAPGGISGVDIGNGVGGGGDGADSPVGAEGGNGGGGGAHGQAITASGALEASGGRGGKGGDAPTSGFVGGAGGGGAGGYGAVVSGNNGIYLSLTTRHRRTRRSRRFRRNSVRAASESIFSAQAIRSPTLGRSMAAPEGPVAP